MQKSPKYWGFLLLLRSIRIKTIVALSSDIFATASLFVCVVDIQDIANAVADGVPRHRGVLALEGLNLVAEDAHKSLTTFLGFTGLSVVVFLFISIAVVVHEDLVYGVDKVGLLLSELTWIELFKNVCKVVNNGVFMMDVSAFHVFAFD